jgi:hypothetical protein
MDAHLDSDNQAFRWHATILKVQMLRALIKELFSCADHYTYRISTM